MESKHRMYVLYITDHGVRSPFGLPCVKNIKENYIHLTRGKGWVIYNERIISPKLEPEEQFLCFKSLKI